MNIDRELEDALLLLLGWYYALPDSEATAAMLEKHGMIARGGGFSAPLRIVPDGGKND